MNKAKLLQYQHEAQFPVVTNTRTYREMAALAQELAEKVTAQQKKIDEMETGFIISSRKLQNK